jgi:hypothetical protein
VENNITGNSMIPYILARVNKLIAGKSLFPKKRSRLWWCHIFFYHCLVATSTNGTLSIIEP